MSTGPVQGAARKPATLPIRNAPATPEPPTEFSRSASPSRERELEGPEHARREDQEEHREPDGHRRMPEQLPERRAGARRDDAERGEHHAHAHHVARGEEHRLAPAHSGPRAEHADGDGDERVDARGERGEQPAEEDQAARRRRAALRRAPRRRRGWPSGPVGRAAGMSARPSAATAASASTQAARDRSACQCSVVIVTRDSLRGPSRKRPPRPRASTLMSGPLSL